MGKGFKTQRSSGNDESLRGISKKPRKLSALQHRMKKKLNSAQFRMLNESMYTHTGATSKAMMDANPQLFEVYHSGYAEQVRTWPRNPLDDIIKYLSTQDRSWKIIDLGCGEARLAKEVPQQNVMSFDLVAVNDTVTACDISKLPLEDKYADVAVFCLSLMGTDYSDFLIEARRVLRAKGLMIIAEVASRFAGHNPSSFVAGVESLGFRLLRGHTLSQLSGTSETQTSRMKKRKQGARATTSIDANEKGSSAFFYLFAFIKDGKESSEKQRSESSQLPSLAACLYKRR